MMSKFDYEKWKEYYLNMYDHTEKAKFKVTQPWTIEINKRFYEEEGYFLPRGDKVSDKEKLIREKLVSELLKNEIWKKDYIKL